MSAVVCPIAHCGALLEFSVVNGKLVEHCPRCARRRAGICRDCPNRVSGGVGKSIRCLACRQLRRREAERKRREDPEYRARRSAYYVRRKRDPVVRERRRLQRRAWRARNRDKVRNYRRRYFLKQTPGYIAGYRRHNADPVRAAKKRAQALAKYYELHPVRPDPHCSGCGVKIDWKPKPGGRAGRPRLTCDNCCSPAELRRRRRGDNKAAYRHREKAA